MTPTYHDATLTLFTGDCLEVMPELEAGSVDAVVTDPPYGLEFMGKEWDRLGRNGPASFENLGTEGGMPTESGTAWPGRAKKGSRVSTRYFDKPRFSTLTNESMRAAQQWHERWAREAFRLLKPGGHLLAFGGTRTYHRLASAIEDAGFEIRDCLVWAYASGFPKSLDVSKAIDKAAGAEREVVAENKHAERYPNGPGGVGFHGGPGEYSQVGRPPEPLTAPATDDAKRWDGWGTALKPAWEPIVMARKPLQGTVAANVLRHGVGALNIDGTRIGMSVADREAARVPQRDKHGYGSLGDGAGRNGETNEPHAAGRWPANVVLTDAIFDGDTPGVVGGGDVNSGGPPVRQNAVSGFGGGGGDRDPAFYGDTGTYSRFFLIPKEARTGREPAVRGQLPVVDRPNGNKWTDQDYRTEWKDGADRSGSVHRQRSNTHPTVKPLELMRHLVRLVTPPGGTVLDCFLGSGTTALAAIREGFRCIGIEREAEYMAITMARLHGTQVGIGL